MKIKHITIKQVTKTEETVSLDDFYSYAQWFGCEMGEDVFDRGTNVLRFVLTDALKYRGLTLDQLKGKREEIKKENREKH